MRFVKCKKTFTVLIKSFFTNLVIIDNIKIKFCVFSPFLCDNIRMERVLLLCLQKEVNENVGRIKT